MALAWYKLERNWRKEVPEIVHPVRSSPCPGRVEFISIVSGTHIMVLFLVDTKQFLCWDAEEGVPFPFDCMDSCIAGTIMAVSDSTLR